MRKKTVYIDMDGVLADYDKAAVGMSDDDKRQAGFFLNLEPIQDAIGAFNLLSSHYEVYILSTAPWSNIHAPSEKRMWVEKHLGDKAFKRLILSHNKSLVKGEYLIDDRIANGVEGFEGEHIHFGSSKFPDWRSVLNYLNVA
jgi:5'-nucleotidase